MGGIWYQAIEFANTMSELIGHKSGLALSRGELVGHLDNSPEWARLFEMPDDQMFRIRSEEVEAIVAQLLYRVGNIETPEVRFPSMFHQFKHDKDNLDAYFAIMHDYNILFKEAMDVSIESEINLIDPTNLLKEISRKYGDFGLNIACSMLGQMNAMIHRSPWTSVRSIEWLDERELRDLFESENLETPHGQYFDQRFIDYLQANFDRIVDINWHQFEGFAAEYLAREGFLVDLGPGRNDDGVDIRVYMANTPAGLPPTMIVQCKRERRKISKVVVKSLWADIVHERAASGLIVTTTELSPGAAKTCRARGYPIEQAGRDSLLQWVTRMRTPGAGVFG